MKKKIPSFKSDAAAERFVSRADLTRYDLSGLKPVRFAPPMDPTNVSASCPSDSRCYFQ
jgi:CopG antitoxin of type II toxin-antitoxin system